MNRKTLAILAFCLLLANPVLAQTQRKNILEDTNLQFFLEGEPTPQDAGFDNPKGFWQVSYAVYLTDYAELIKLGICHKGKNRVLECDPAEDEKSKNRIKEKSMRIAKGGFTRKSLSNELSREEKVKIKLSPEVVDIFNQAAENPEKNPTFVVIIDGKVSINGSNNQKLDEKYSLTSIKKLKTGSARKDFEYWDVRRMYLTTRVVRLSDGKLSLSRGLLM